MTKLNIVLAQINTLVGDIDGNTQKILEVLDNYSQDSSIDLIVFPELTLTGYPPEDLLLRESIKLRVERALVQIMARNSDTAVVVGFPRRTDKGLYNAVALIVNGQIAFEYHKRCLPNYEVFDEKRYFSVGEGPVSLEYKGHILGFAICEDLWEGESVKTLKDVAVDLVIAPNASPFHQFKQQEREDLISLRAKELSAGIIYVNHVGGQDELVFDGASFVMNAEGECVGRAAQFEEHLLEASYVADANKAAVKFSVSNSVEHTSNELKITYDALVLGVRDYVNKNGFRGVVLGLSGGIDSALTLAIAVDALGAERVQAVMMPFRYTSKMSCDDAAEEARLLGVKYHSISIESIYESFMASLDEVFRNTEVDTTEQNIQARSRGVLLMAMSNKLGFMVLTTGNKSEMAVGYATLYGDMAGGLDVLKDVPKTQVFELSRYRNTIEAVIPENVITRPPSAELAPDQIDEDSLPPYEILDQILEHYIEQDMSAHAIIELGFNEQEVRKVLRLVDINEYKRRQAPIGIRLSQKAFGRDRRYPVTNGWKIGD
ncbi:MAG: NAD+ synthase (glutamine-hydrolyzing) [Flavobacteriales bacterium]|jgi:NAD+ synthase (glutamine-hydrolysing)